jgi:excisionase family DNA binding protein
MASQRMLKVGELAERLNVSPKVIYGLRYRSDGPPAIRVGRELRFRVEDVEQWEASRRDDGSTHAS